MKLPLKSKKIITVVAVLCTSLLASILLFWNIIGTVWTKWDFQILDFYYRYAVSSGHGVPGSAQIVYVLITDDSYAYFGHNILNRADMARVNNALADLGIAAVAYDIIFARSSHADADAAFTASLSRLGTVYLPIGFNVLHTTAPFQWEEGVAYERLHTDSLKQPVERGIPQPLFATKAVMQLDDFAAAAFNSGHISVATDDDGVFRHIPMLLKIDSRYIPALSLAIFLDYVKVSFHDVIVHWGKHIIIPATKSERLKNDVVIPIDKHGRVFIPYPQTWEKDFPKVAAHTLMKSYDDVDLRGNLSEFFEEKFVLIGDVSIGISDVGSTPLEESVPLVAIHTAVLNGLFTNTFYQKWSFWKVQGLICLLSLLLALAALLRASGVLYITGGILLLGILGFVWLQCTQFILLPIFTIGSSVTFLFFGLVIGLEVAIAKDQTFIRNAFSKYVPEKVVNQLLAHPGLLKLGGEERVLSVLFSDLESFTTIAESMSPTELVSLLNEYLTEMTAIVLAQGGIIDKYEGDAIMAEFGAPLALANHAELAVRAGLQMQRRMQELRQVWEKRSLPMLRCRVGINTGSMLVGNMGSHQVFDYTVIGDAVNLASRLEGANKLYRTYMMIAESTYIQLTPGMFRTRVLDVIRVKGKTRAIKVFEVYGESTDPVETDDLLYYQTYHDAFEAYLARDFTTARKQFATALSVRPDDPAAHNMIARIATLSVETLPDDWDGSVSLTSK